MKPCSTSSSSESDDVPYQKSSDGINFIEDEQENIVTYSGEVGSYVTVKFATKNP